MDDAEIDNLSGNRQEVLKNDDPVQAEGASSGEGSGVAQNMFMTEEKGSSSNKSHKSNKSSNRKKEEES